MLSWNTYILDLIIFLLLLNRHVVFCQVKVSQTPNENGRPSEDQRIRIWHESGNVWPPLWREESKLYKVLEMLLTTMCNSMMSIVCIIL